MKKILLFLLFISILGCDVSFKRAHRSGTLMNDYIEEPVPEKYEKYLESTNFFMDAYATKQFDFVVENYLDPEFRPELRKEDLESLSGYIDKHAGLYRSYLKGQWGFVPENREGVKMLHSVKIVEHERATMHYIITFSQNSKNHKVIGLTIKERKGVRAPEEL